MKEFLENFLNCKVVNWCDHCFWSFRLKGHYWYLGLIYPQPYGSRIGNDWYTLLCDNKTLIRKGTFEECINKVKTSDPVTR